MENTRKFLTAIGIAAVAGALFGVLFAPYKGSRTRRVIKGKGKKIADEVQDKFRKGKEKFNDLKAKVDGYI